MSMIKTFIKSQPKLYLLGRSIKYRLMGGHEAELGLLSVLVDPKRVAVDVGANWGVYSEALSNIASHVIAVEAIPELAASLRKMLPKVEVVNAAASDTPGHVTLSIPENNFGLSSVAHSDFNDDGAVRKIEVEAITLDQFFANRSDDIGFIKIDVEGHELAVLNGARKVIEKHRPTMLIEAEERHAPGTVAGVFSYFTSLGYSGFFMDGVLRSLTSYDPAIHQSLVGVDMAMLDRGDYHGRYANNFIFIP